MTGLQWWAALVRQERVGAVIADIEPGGGGFEGVGAFLQSGVAGIATVWGRDLGAYPSDEAGPG